MNKIESRYDEETGIFYRYYLGSFGIEDLIAGWEEVFKNGLLPQHAKKFVLDYRQALLVADPKAAKDIANIYKKYKHVFIDARVALIMTDPNQVIFPLLVNEEQSIVEFKPFYTVEAAVQWLQV